MKQADIENKLIKNISVIARILASGKDCELRRSSSGVTVVSVTKKVVNR